jgi:Na+-driven multidrug efflux pump
VDVFAIMRQRLRKSLDPIACPVALRCYAYRTDDSQSYADMIAALTAKYRLLFPSVKIAGESAAIGGIALERQRRLLLTAITSAFARGVSVLSALITVPLALNYLGPEQYGIWVTLSSFALLLAFADLGIGNGVINAVSRYLGMNDIDGMRRCISTAYVILGLTALTVMTLFAILYWSIPWNRVFNVHSAEAIAQAGPASAVFFLANRGFRKAFEPMPGQ